MKVPLMVPVRPAVNCCWCCWYYCCGWCARTALVTLHSIMTDDVAYCHCFYWCWCCACINFAIPPWYGMDPNKNSNDRITFQFGIKLQIQQPRLRQQWKTQPRRYHRRLHHCRLFVCRQLHTLWLVMPISPRTIDAMAVQCAIATATVMWIADLIAVSAVTMTAFVNPLCIEMRANVVRVHVWHRGNGVTVIDVLFLSNFVWCPTIVLRGSVPILLLLCCCSSCCCCINNCCSGELNSVTAI